MSKIYVGTYGKYNAGSIKGGWLDLEDYNSKQEFIDACYKLHADENDPELMFQDWEDIPSSFISESSLDERTWDWLSLDEDERKTVSAYLDEVDQSSDVDSALEAFDGEHDSEEDWARDFWEQTGMTSQLPEFAQNYIDYQGFARDASMGGDITFVNQGRRVKAFRR
jgi:antirestriction protein